MNIQEIDAVLINHNSSAWAEIALRSLLSGFPATGPKLRVTVVDNHSEDDIGPLRKAAAELGAEFEQSRWPAREAERNTHGDVLRDFVLARPKAQAFLFVESDICFLSANTIPRMLEELEQAPNIWAVQAVLVSGRRQTEDELRAVTLTQMRRRRRIGLSARLYRHGEPVPVLAKDWGTQWAQIMPRCHPGCALIRNTPAFARTARHIGFSANWNWSGDRWAGGFSDTLALTSQVMTTHGMRFVYSSESVVHFGHGSKTPLGGSRAELLERLRRGRCDDVEALALALES